MDKAIQKGGDDSINQQAANGGTNIVIDTVNHNQYGAMAADELNDYGIIEELLNHLIANLPVSDDGSDSDAQITHIKDKLALNFAGDPLQVAIGVVTTLWKKKQIVANCVMKKMETDEDEIAALVLKIQCDYRSAKNSQAHWTAIEDTKIIEDIASQYLPPSKRTNPTYYANAQAILWYFFEMCDFGKKTDAEMERVQPLPLI